jgi:hypothetical protein
MAREASTASLEPTPLVDREGEALCMDGCTFFDFKYEGGSIIAYYQNAAGEPRDIDSDLLIAADGPSSTYVGYCGWRGAVPKS